MSMLSAQCDELRTMAEGVGLEVPQAATLMMEAADTIWELRCKCAGMVDMRERARLAETENAKLRELVADMYMRFHGVVIENWAYSSEDFRIYEQRLRELGIEVGQ